MRTAGFGCLLLFPQQKQNAEHSHSPFTELLCVPGESELSVVWPDTTLSTSAAGCVNARHVFFGSEFSCESPDL